MVSKYQRVTQNNRFRELRKPKKNNQTKIGFGSSGVFSHQHQNLPNAKNKMDTTTKTPSSDAHRHHVLSVTWLRRTRCPKQVGGIPSHRRLRNPAFEPEPGPIKQWRRCIATGVIRTVVYRRRRHFPYSTGGYYYCSYYYLIMLLATSHNSPTYTRNCRCYVDCVS